MTSQHLCGTDCQDQSENTEVKFKDGSFPQIQRPVSVGFRSILTKELELVIFGMYTGSQNNT